MSLLADYCWGGSWRWWHALVSGIRTCYSQITWLLWVRHFTLSTCWSMSSAKTYSCSREFRLFLLCFTTGKVVIVKAMCRNSHEIAALLVDNIGVQSKSAHSRVSLPQQIEKDTDVDESCQWDGPHFDLQRITDKRLSVIGLSFAHSHWLCFVSLLRSLLLLWLMMPCLLCALMFLRTFRIRMWAPVVANFLPVPEVLYWLLLSPTTAV